MRLLYLVFIVMFTLLVGDGVLYAQTKPAAKSLKDGKPDTTIIFAEEKKAEPPKHLYNPKTDMKETVIIINLSDTAPKPKPTYKDTIIIIKRGPTKEERAAMEKAKIADEMKANNYCSCVKMDIKSDNTLPYEAYLNYSFIFKNDCKIDVWVSSKHFRFTPLNSFDVPVKVIRKLSFVQRYDHPDFVKIAPGETYTFSYADDAFFEYDLKKGQNYKFVFEHRNFGDRSKHAPQKTYLCNQKRVQLISIK